MNAEQITDTLAAGSPAALSPAALSPAALSPAVSPWVEVVR
jgi:hypothetical protein